MTYHRYYLVKELYYSFEQDYQMHEHIVQRFVTMQHYVLPEMKRFFFYWIDWKENGITSE